MDDKKILFDYGRKSHALVEKKDNINLVKQNEMTVSEIVIKPNKADKNGPSTGNSNRCNLSECNKRLTLTESTMKCKCGNIFCTTHRFSEKHNCTFDYRGEAKQKIEQSLNKVIADKIIKI